MGFDRWLLRTLAQHRVAWVTQVAKAAMRVGTSLMVIGLIAVLGAVYLVVTRRWRQGASVALAVGATGAIVSVLKTIIDRPRPPREYSIIWVNGPSMPSTHAARIAAAAAGLLLAIEWRNRRTQVVVCLAAAFSVIVIGFFLVYLGTHWPTDVLAGWAIGVAAGVAAARLSRSVGAARVRRE